MTIATKNGAIIVKDGKLAESCGCCGDCQTHVLPPYVVANNGCGGGGVLHGEKTITIPDKYALPCEVNITGFVDDDLAINGVVVQDKEFIRGDAPFCNPAHNVCYAFTSNSRTFTIAAIDNYGLRTSYNLTICFNQSGACCTTTSGATTCAVKPPCNCAGTGQVFQGAGTTCSPNPCDTICKPCNAGTTPAKETVTAVVDNIVLIPSPTNPFTLEQLNDWLAGTYILEKTDIGVNYLVAYTFGGWPNPTGSRSADMLYDCRVAGDSFIDPQGGPVCTVSYRQPGFEIKLFCYPPQSTQRGNVCTGVEERAFGTITNACTARMTVS